jgi:hypothetical protein
MRIPTPTRARHSDRREPYDPNENGIMRSEGFEGDFDDDVFEIGSSDEEENAFFTHPMGDACRDEKLNEALNTWGKPGESADKLGALCGVGRLNLGQMKREASCPNTFYMGTPRTDMPWE